jgi:hypothetical protein
LDAAKPVAYSLLTVARFPEAAGSMGILPAVIPPMDTVAVPAVVVELTRAGKIKLLASAKSLQAPAWVKYTNVPTLTFVPAAKLKLKLVAPALGAIAGANPTVPITPRHYKPVVRRQVHIPIETRLPPAPVTDIFRGGLQRDVVV